MPDIPPYVQVLEGDPLDQGEIILNCPTVTWTTPEFEWPESGPVESALESKLRMVLSADVVVVTQTCDFEKGKAPFVTLCLIVTLAEAKPKWQSANRKASQNPTDKAWSSYLRNVNNDTEVQLAYLPRGHADGEDIPARMAYLSPAHTLPNAFLLQFVQRRGGKRVRLNSPFRERLSYRFATQFARIGVKDVDKLTPERANAVE